MWEEVLSPKYGSIDSAPYDAVKVPLTLNTKKRMVDWILSFDDKELSTRMLHFLNNIVKNV